MCSALCNESTLQYHPDKGKYEKIGESTEVALRVFAEKVCICMFLCVSYFYVVNVVCEATLGLKSILHAHLLFLGWSPWF